jgi:hypothetical protein
MSGGRRAGLQGDIELFPFTVSRSSICQGQKQSGWLDQQPVARKPMQKPPLDPDVADTAPSESVLTVYDEEHLIMYLRLLDADAQGADWREVARIVLHLDPEHESDRARRVFESHLSRDKWMTEHGYRHLLRGGASA